MVKVNKMCTGGGDLVFHSCYDVIVASKIHLSLVCTAEDTESGLHDGCGRTVWPRLAVCSTVFKLEWSLMYCKDNVVFFSGLTLGARAIS